VRGPEGKIQDKLRAKLDLIPSSFWFVPTDTNKVGCPDIIGDIKGRAVYIEVKKDAKTKPRPLQRYRIQRATERGAISFCTYGWEHCKSILQEKIHSIDV